MRTYCWGSIRGAAPIIAVVFSLVGCGGKPDHQGATLFTAHDQIFSEPIVHAFQKQTGSTVKTAFDTEASKTTGLVNRIIAEAGKPQCDVFWNNEIAQTIILKKKGLLQPYRSPAAEDIPDAFKDPDGYWAGFAARVRVLLVNTDLVPEGNEPKSIFELTDPKWRGQVAMAYPLFGTTATHAAALSVALGDDKAAQFYRDLKANDVVIVDGNATAKDRVADGHLKVCFTDTDDANVAIQAGKPVKVIYPDQDGIGTLLIPNTVCLIKAAPHPEAGKKLIDFLLSRKVESMLAHSNAVQMPLRAGVDKPPHVPDFSDITSMTVDWEKVADQMKPTAEFMQKLFVR